MPDVDDLIISLTIKEGGKLDNLRKQLKTIVGKTGEKTPEFELDPDIRRRIYSIDDRIKWIHPVVTPRTNVGIIEALRITRRDLQEYKERASQRIRRVEPHERDLEDWGVTTVEDLDKVMGEQIDDLILRLNSMIAMGIGGPKAQELNDRIRSLISGLEKEGGYRKSMYDYILKGIKEFQGEIEQLFKKLGIPIISQPGAWKPIMQKFKEIASIRLTGGEEGPRKIEEFYGIGKEKEVTEAWKKIQGLPFLKSTKTIIDFIESAYAIFKKHPEADISVEKIMGDPELKAIARGINMMMFRESTMGKVGGIPLKEWKDVVMNALIDSYPKLEGKQRELFDYTISDIMVLGGAKIEELLKVFSREQAEKIAKAEMSIVELKNILTKANIDQILKQAKYFGKEPHLLTASIKKSFIDRLPEILVNTINIMKLLEKEGVFKPLSEEELKEIGKKNQKIIEKEIKERKITEIIKEKTPEEQQKILETLREKPKETEKQIIKKETEKEEKQIIKEKIEKQQKEIITKEKQIKPPLEEKKEEQQIKIITKTEKEFITALRGKPEEQQIKMIRERVSEEIKKDIAEKTSRDVEYIRKNIKLIAKDTAEELIKMLEARRVSKEITDELRGLM